MSHFGKLALCYVQFIIYGEEDLFFNLFLTAFGGLVFIFVIPYFNNPQKARDLKPFLFLVRIFIVIAIVVPVGVQLFNDGKCISNDRLVGFLKESGDIQTDEVENAFRQVDRAYYSSQSACPYFNIPQPIGHGATISAPYIHAKALEIISSTIKNFKNENVGKQMTILDVGSGSGFLTACIGVLLNNSLCGKVYGIEHSSSLVNQSIQTITQYNSFLIDKNIVEILEGDGFEGLASHEPFDFIHVGASTPVIPTKLLQQLAIGGSIFVPVGSQKETQVIKVVKKIKDPHSQEISLLSHDFMQARYVPLISKE